MPEETKKLKSLEQYEYEIQSAYRKSREGWTGIACPDCGEELIHSDNDVCVIDQFLPKRNVRCSKCPYHGTITV